MKTVAEFEKINIKLFKDELKRLGYDSEDPGAAYEALKMPRRATSGSAGYDFCSPVAFTLEPGESKVVPTGIRAKIEEGWFLMIVPRSGLGFKYRLRLDNTVGIIDSDYYFSDNEGHIQIKLTNEGLEGKTLCISAGERFAQGIFLPYGVAAGDTASGVRNGGMGSTDRT